VFFVVLQEIVANETIRGIAWVSGTEMGGPEPTGLPPFPDTALQSAWRDGQHGCPGTGRRFQATIWHCHSGDENLNLGGRFRIAAW